MYVLSKDFSLGVLRMGHYVLNKCVDGDGLEPMLLRKGKTIVAAGHHAVVLTHELADHARGPLTREPAQVYSGLGVTTADDNASITRSQRKYMPRTVERTWVARGAR